MKNPYLLRMRNVLAIGFALPALALAMTQGLSRFSSHLDYWIRCASWFFPAILILALLSLVTCIWTWRESKSAKFVPPTVILGWIIISISAIGTW